MSSANRRASHAIVRAVAPVRLADRCSPKVLKCCGTGSSGHTRVYRRAGARCRLLCRAVLYTGMVLESASMLGVHGRCWCCCAAFYPTTPWA